MKMSHYEIQEDIIRKYRVDICDGSKCKNDWRRTHAHVKERRVCKWKRASSVQSTFTLLHEVGHIETTTSGMRRCESEYFATVWALERCREYGIKVPEKTIRAYQDYIDREKDRGVRRGGSGYGNLSLWKYLQSKPLTIEAPYLQAGVEYECGGGGVDIRIQVNG